MEDYSHLTYAELLEEYRASIENLPGTRARGRSWFYAVEK